MKKNYPTSYYTKLLILAFALMGISVISWGQRVYAPLSNNNITAATSYCKNASASLITYTYNTCNAGTGSSSGTPVTITWYENTVNSTSGGSVVSVTLVNCALTGTGNSSYLPPTSVVGTLYYYCTITWTASGTCNAAGSLTSAVTSVTVNTTPDAITGPTSGCVGTSTTLSNAVAGGNWVSSNTAVATITATGAIGTGATGTTTISYTIGLCRVTRTFNGITTPAGITGASTVCEGSATAWNNATTGGTWTSANTAIATTTTTSPANITGVSAGSTTVTYALYTGCYTTQTVTVNATPPAIGGTASVCTGNSTTMTNTLPGGRWQSSNVARATVDTLNGVVTGVSAGALTITYTVNSCRATVPFTSKSSPVAITGTNTICQSATTTFSDATASGTWSSSNTAVASINASSPVTITGGTTGGATISYTLSNGCFSTRGITVNTAPGPITGATSTCLGSSVTLGNAVAGGIWTSATPARATIDSITGVITTVSAGTTTITYSIGNCRSTINFTVSPVPAAISATATDVCAGSTITYTNAVAGGTWTSSNTAIATVSASGAVRGVAAGTATITYALGSCYVTSSVTANTQPAAITGSTSACLGTNITLSNAVAGGTWTSSAPSIASINASGSVTTVANGLSTISYTIGSCASAITFTTLIPPAAITASTSSVCRGTTLLYSNTTIGGTWSSSGSGVASVNSSTGLVTGVTVGSATITYSTGCGTATTRPITVNTAPAAIAGPTAMCTGTISTLTNTVSGGTWSSSAPTVASINATTGAVNPVGVGSSIISYSIGTCATGRTITVSAQPTTITGPSLVCLSGSITLGNTVAGGTWTSSNTTIATTDAGTGVVTGVAAGTANITYTTGCGTPAVKTINVTLSSSPITGDNALCTGGTYTLANAVAGGTWTSSSPANATINSASGIATAITAGSSIITYTMSGGCVTTFPVTVNTQPAAITGSPIACAGAPTTLSNAVAGGVWSSSNTLVATINSVTGIINGVTAGSADITYANNNCIVTMPISSVLPPAIPAAITGASILCNGSMATLSSTTTGGNWSSSDTTIASVNTTTGVVTGVSAATATITYTIYNVCGSNYRTRNIDVATKPNAAITSADEPCMNTATTVVFSGTPGATITYNVDGGSNIMHTLGGGTYSISTGSLTATHYYTLVAVHDTVCSSTIDTAATIIPIPMQWIGGIPGHEAEWANAGNWSCGAIPDSTADVTIPGGTLYSPELAAATTISVKSLTLSNSATINSNTGSALQVKQELTNNGYFKGDGVVYLNGSATQLISGTGQISNVQLNNNTGATIYAGAKMTVTGTLTINAGTLATNDSLVLASDSVATARIAPIASGAAITGKVKMQQYIPGGYRRYRFWSHPFDTSLSLGQLMRNIDITGAGGASNGFTTTTTNAASAFRLDPYTSNSTMGYDPGWKPFTKINAAAADSNKLKKHQGIRLFFRGSKGEGLGYVFHYVPSPVVVAMSGYVNQGTQTMTLAKGADTTQDYNLLGNPYPAPVDIGTVIYNAKMAGKVAGTAFYVWDPSIGSGGQYLAIPIGTTGAIPYSIQANAAFEVRAANDSDQLVFTENNKTASYDNNLFKMQDDATVLKIYDTDYHLWDALKLQYNTQATEGEDKDYDATKPSGADFNFYSLAGNGRKLAIDARPYNEQTAIPLGITSGYAQAFIIRAEQIATAATAPLYLHDKLLEQYVLLQPGAEYKFAITKDKATQGNDRFELTTKPGSTIADEIKVSLAPNPATDEVTITCDTDAASINISDMLGASVYSRGMGSLPGGTIKVSLHDLSPGIYMVEVATGSKKATHKLVKE